MFSLIIIYNDVYTTVVLYQEAPSGVTLTDVKPNELTFSWTLVDSACDPSGYNITSDCGTCRIATATTATCTDLRLPSRCYYSIQNVVCGQVGPASTPITITLRGTYMYIHCHEHFAVFMITFNISIAPNQPNVTFVPVYSADTQKLIKFKAVVYQEVSELCTHMHSLYGCSVNQLSYICRLSSILQTVYLAQLLTITSPTLVIPH